MAEIRHRPCEVLPARGSGGVRQALVYDVLVFCQVLVDVLREVFREDELRQDGGGVDVVSLHFVRDFHGVLDDFRVVGEDGRHLVLRLEVFLLGVADTVRVVVVVVEGEADEAVVGRAVFLADEVDVVGRDDLHVVLGGQLEDGFVHHLLHHVDLCVGAGDFGLVALHLEVEVVAEKVFVPFDGGFGFLEVAAVDGSRDLAGQTGGAADDAFVVFLQELAVDLGFLVEAVDEGVGAELHEVVVAGHVLGQQDEVVRAALLFVVGQEAVVVRRDVHLAADDGLHVRVFLGVLEEFLHAVHVAVVRDGEGGLAVFVRLLEELRDGGGAIKDGVLCMDVQVYESHVVAGSLRAPSGRRNSCSGRQGHRLQIYVFSPFFAPLVPASFPQMTPVFDIGRLPAARRLIFLPQNE